ncbi:nucleotidyl transferase AbiEii/AbiGii toxin family protein [Jiangella alba]|uniref:Nucleotidyl transferase AbiEii toxin, Type IV TA system n=1 Tax=Jiangella alba TaxID=561176 RepID=A0A1H5P633_9ACTN|nr:nucleotidyl transferase AbiEii/AbiGii toxin family protein [Jiangella alba]SEF08511.1 Nucleotidyl transferase AbiEii toxin, Type IV TA system [Jiangella alba]
MLDPDEERSVAAAFGVATAQVRRDHFISHVLAALSERFADRLLFFGGTALSRTHLPDGRLSEDVDLISLGSRSGLATDLDGTLPRALRREFPGSGWRPALGEVRESHPASLVATDGTTVRVQLLSHTGYAPWPTERRALVQRYSDAAPATLTVPTLASFVAWKTVAWIDRAAPRDLYDLWLLTELGAVDAAAGDLFRRFGPTNRLPHPRQFATAPDEETWRRALGGQTRLQVSGAEALAGVRGTWQALTP